jgi:hypothetical protein
MRSLVIEGRGLPFFFCGGAGWGGGRGIFFSRRVDCPHLTFYTSFFFWGFVLGKGSKQRVPKFLTCSPKEFPIAPHFFPIYAFANVVLLSPIYVCKRAKNSILQNKTFIFGEPA